MTDTQFCAKISREREDPIIGQAAYAKAWLLIEYNGPWEWGAVLDNQLPEAVKAWLSAIIYSYATTHTVALFIRHDMRPLAKIRCFVAITREAQEALYRFELSSYEELLKLDLDALRAGDPAYNTYLSPEPIYLVCTNGKHDKCCAKFGMPIYQEASRLVGEQAWHCTHMGGDQYAANLLCLPRGLYYSRVSVPEVTSIIEADGHREIYLPKARGRTCYQPAVQAAEYYLRQQTGNLHLDAFSLLATHSAETNVETVHLQATEDGTIHTLTIQHEIRELSSSQPCSCRNEAKNTRYEFRLLSYASSSAACSISP
ncbi:hypothetical protein EPA93_02140 [Ktedonosporobacter rubrisoli]|uniref:Sucrase ferredoxin n=1 Tax=Ktedonosporobacter rubrisoli TaxID=2509675 RepID=A0A4P6JJN0_KTERU|nr:sucrase ferredoxin [Ktedonosporobacter rubrisoli]QBD74856.1 hypothetical protein EPA93_02140 [Ktedonosporobacter rubrisoli]